MKQSLKKFYLIIIVVFVSTCFLNQADSYAQLNIQNYLELGKRSLFSGEYQEAIRRFNAIIKINNKLYQPYFFRGVAKFNLGDLVGARYDFSFAIELHPYFSHAYHYRGISQERLNNYNSAIRDYNLAIEIDPVNPDIYSSRGFTKVLLNDTVGAMADFNEAILIDSRNYQAYLNRSMVWTMMKEYEKALGDCKQAISINKYNVESFYRRGLIYYQMEDYPNALDDFNFIIKLDSTNSRAIYYRALTKYKQDDLAGAMADYDLVIELDPLNALTYYNRAILRTQGGDYQGAIFDYNRVIELNPNNIFAFFNRGGARLNTGELLASIDDFTRVIELYPGFTQAYLNRSVAKSKMYDFAGAEEDRLLAEKISSDSFLQKNFARIDSSYFNKLIELKANFENGNIAGTKFSIMNFSVQMKQVYIISIVENKYISPFYEKDILSLNSQLGEAIKIGFTHPDNQKSLDEKELLAAIEKVNINKDKYLIGFIKGILYGNLNDFNSAFLNMNAAIKESPDNYLLLFTMAGLKFQLTEMLNSIDVKNDFLMIGNREEKRNIKKSDNTDDYENLLKTYNHILVLKPDLATAYYNRAYVKSMLNSLPEAIYDYNQAISLNKDFADAYYNRALIHLYYNETEKGCRDLSKAGELGIKDAYFAISKYCR